MGIKKLNPVTPGTRFKVAPTFEEITTNKPHKPLVVTLKKTGGRNNQGKRTMRMIGGGHKRNYRLIDFKRISTESIVRFLLSNTIQIVLHVLH